MEVVPVMRGMNFDLTLTVDGYHYNCHKQVLIRRGGDYFKALLSTNFIENGMPKIELKGLPSTGFNEILNYIYTGRFRVSRENVYGLLVLSDSLLLKEVKKVCINFICHEPTIDHIFEIYTLGYVTRDVKLLNAIRGHLLKMFEWIITSEDFLKLRFDVLKSICQEKDVISIGNDYNVFQAAINWLKYDEPKRAQFLDYIPRLIVNVSHVHAPYVRNLFASHELFKSRCLDFDAREPEENNALEFANLQEVQPVAEIVLPDLQELQRGIQLFPPRIEVLYEQVAIVPDDVPEPEDDIGFNCPEIQESDPKLFSPDFKKFHLIISERGVVQSKTIHLKDTSFSGIAISPTFGKIMVNTIDERLFIYGTLRRGRGATIVGVNPNNDLDIPINISLPYTYRNGNCALVKSNLHLLCATNRVSNGEVGVEEYNFERGSWQHLITCPPGFTRNSVIANNNMVYFFGDNQLQNNFGFMDYREQIYHSLNPTFYPRYNAAASIYGRRLYLASGPNAKENSIEVFDMAANKWYNLFNAFPPLERYKMQVAEEAVHVYGGFVFLERSGRSAALSVVNNYVYRAPLSTFKLDEWRNGGGSWTRKRVGVTQFAYDSYAM